MDENNPILKAASELLGSKRSTEEVLDLFREAVSDLSIQAEALEDDVAHAEEVGPE